MGHALKKATSVTYRDGDRSVALTNHHLRAYSRNLRRIYQDL